MFNFSKLTFHDCPSLLRFLFIESIQMDPSFSNFLIIKLLFVSSKIFGGVCCFVFLEISDLEAQLVLPHTKAKQLPLATEPVKLFRAILNYSSPFKSRGCQKKWLKPTVTRSHLLIKPSHVMLKETVNLSQSSFRKCM